MPSESQRHPRQNGEAIKTIRTLRGLTRNDLAVRSKASYSHIANLELEEKAPSPELIHRIAAALDVPVAALLREPLNASSAGAA